MRVHGPVRPNPEHTPRASAPRPASRPPAALAADPPRPDGAFRQALRTLGRELDRGEALMGGAIRGGHRDLSPERLLALQAGIYRYTEAVDLAAKVVDRAGNAAKTVLQGSGG
ncbi:MAG: hypothetical protein IT376_07595 [Polyangiaceae bacterium]|nr:hypothetical protein [Polyangiaceae bacterium]